MCNLSIYLAVHHTVLLLAAVFGIHETKTRNTEGRTAGTVNRTTPCNMPTIIGEKNTDTIPSGCAMYELTRKVSAIYIVTFIYIQQLDKIIEYVKRVSYLSIRYMFER